MILDQPRGAGYWLWKPYIIKDALAGVDFGDYVFYVDSGAFYVHDIHPLIEAMEREKTYAMPMSIGSGYPERIWSKRDAFILMDCEGEKIFSTPQRESGFIFLKKTSESVALIDEFLEYAQDPRILTDIPNQLGKENYEGFKENRHDQTVWSLLTKKKGIKPFRDPLQFSTYNKYSKDVLDRSTYPTTFYLHRRSVGFNRTIEDFLRIYADEPRFNEGIRTAKYLLEEGMVKESYEILWRLNQKYGDGYDEAWINAWEDLRYIFFKHKELGSPYAEIFQPCLCKLLWQILRRRVNFNQIPDLIPLIDCVENKNYISQELQNALARLVAGYANQAARQKFPAYMKTTQEILAEYRELNMPIPLE